ncbi:MULTISPECIES: sensor histidine kinase [Psychrobacter]|uniref:sensor histidine kinase n=1 Tax=Psychrobacter TaxID=497 RepID=UPI00086B2A83|nr:MULTISPECIES: ATP-binding protein [Psychrobacter]MBA6245262.1 HAMP domain-containing protein [Psychrobacter sp. Urea-trap-18]MBA6285663.1 HAMP domain-containing protein [Psychrobacter sp. Urea-trap-16]MBA6318910.1 HAMP domain-containing protein [Psychrobacter sp. Urea-trap-20]MBA6333949.1 HAMP domain-containing protein [Psychrobacter sp. Urea-trap-19]OEH68879.1 MAG: two-component sensor histidine kinase [Psychrobacter sp. B29-1]
MKASEQTLKKAPKFKVRITLFWRLFLSLLLTILITSVLSIVVERWLAEKELTSRMDVQIDSLLIKREEMVAALRAGDVDSVRQMYRQDRQLMNQIRVYDEQGAIVFPRYRDQDDRAQGQLQSGRRLMDRAIQPLQQIPPRPPRVENSVYGLEGRNADNRLREHDNEIPKIEPSFWQKFLKSRTASSAAVADIDTRPELADMSVELPDGQSIIIQLRPHLRFSDVVELQHGNFPIRLLLIVIFSVLVCIWLSRTLTQRIGRVQNTVHRMIDGNYQANPELSKMGDDELGLLAKDVAHLSTRLVDSELARKQMLSDISHELRSPLARLDVATELTRDFAPNANRYLDRIDKESTRMNELIEQIIHIQSLQMQQYTVDNLESEAVDISDTISNIGEDVCFEFQHKDVHWQWQPHEASALDSLEGFWTVQGNAEQLYSALENVIRNAFMHTAAGSTVIAEIKAIQMDNKAPAVQINITDEGGGVADKDLERIFHPFVRLDTARHRDTGGYGLGLAIVHAVVMAHKGYINAHNRQDGIQGLVVQIVLPSR